MKGRDSIMETLETLGKRAKAASRLLAGAGTKRKNAALLAVARALEEQSPAILAANAADVAAAREAGMTPALIDRLSLTAARIEGMAEGVRQTAALPDPVGEVVEGFRRPNGLQIRRERVPLGVVGIIYEARPNVTSDAAALCLKAGNAVLLRGGKEAIRANIAIAAAIRDGLASEGLPADAVQLLEDTSRETASAMMRMNEYLDVLIPRGGGGPDPLGGTECYGAGHRNRHRQLPYICGQGRGCGDGGGHRRQRQGVPALGLQRGRNLARPCGYR